MAKEEKIAAGVGAAAPIVAAVGVGAAAYGITKAVKKNKEKKEK